MTKIKPKILLVEDSMSDAAMTLRHLKTTAAFDAAHVLTLSEAKKVALQYQLILLDLSLPDSNGLDGLLELRELCQVPIVILSGLDDEVKAQEAINRGAHDYLAKDLISEGSLKRSITFALLRAEAECSQIALIDKVGSLKDLLNSTSGEFTVALQENNRLLDHLLSAASGQSFNGRDLDTLKKIINNNNLLLKLAGEIIQL